MIEEYLSQNESKTVEFKENTRSLSGIVKTVVAFANTSGGVLLIGVKDKTKEIVGFLILFMKKKESLMQSVIVLPL